jgi:hypothetical protein
MTVRAAAPRVLLALVIAGAALWLFADRARLDPALLETAVRDLGPWAPPGVAGPSTANGLQSRPKGQANEVWKEPSGGHARPHHPTISLRPAVGSKQRPFAAPVSILSLARASARIGRRPGPVARRPPESGSPTSRNAANSARRA